MPLPVAHSLAAAAVYVGLDSDGDRRGWRRLVLAAVIANAPDLDMVPGVLLGDPNRFHHGPSHSLGMTLLVSLAAAALAWWGWRWPLRGRLGSTAVGGTAVMVGALWASHVVLDTLTHDPSEPVGVPILWPLWGGTLLLWPWFPRVMKASGPAGPWEFVLSLLHPHNLWAAAVEVATLTPVVAALLWWRRRREDRRAPGSTGSVGRQERWR